MIPNSCDLSIMSDLNTEHMLVGTFMTAFPEQNIINEKDTTFEVMKTVKQTYRTFWRSQSAEHANQLQDRYKWKIQKKK